VPIVEPPQSSLEPTTTTIAPPTDIPTTTVPETDLVIPDSPTPEEINQLADELVSSITELSDEEITNLVESIDVSELTEESISAVFSEEVLNELSDDQVTELIDAIVPSELSDNQALALSEALTDAPDSVKQKFEQEIDVFGGQFDTYVSTGSTVPVGARRVIVAAAVAAFSMPAPSSSSRRNR
jgi:thymidine phosphorylase